MVRCESPELESETYLCSIAALPGSLCGDLGPFVELLWPCGPLTRPSVLPAPQVVLPTESCPSK